MQIETTRIFVAASCIAAVRTFQQRIAEHEWQTQDSVDDSVRLARMVLRRIKDDPETILGMMIESDIELE